MFEQNSVDAAKRSVELALTQYREGAVDYQRVLDSQRSLLEQQNRLAETRSSIATNLIALYKALGGGWELRQGQPVVAESTQTEMQQGPTGAVCYRRHPGRKRWTRHHQPAIHPCCISPTGNDSCSRSDAKRGEPKRAMLSVVCWLLGEVEDHLHVRKKCLNGELLPIEPQPADRPRVAHAACGPTRLAEILDVAGRVNFGH